MTTLSILSFFAGFFGVVLGLGLPWVVTSRLNPAEKLVLGAAVGIFILYLFAWVVYWAGWPTTTFHALFAFVVAGVSGRWKFVSQLFRDPTIRGILGRQLLFSGWCVAWATLVYSYSGGEWTADWYEHFQRALFFLDRMPLDTRLLSVYLVPARPPLGNLVDVALMGIGGRGFPEFQLINTLFSSLLFLPAALLARHFSADRSDPDTVLLVMMMCNPLVIQNATFTWTKLITVFYVVLATAFYVRGISESSPIRRTIAIGLAAVGVLAHYSAGPYLVALASLQVWRSRDFLRAPGRLAELFFQGSLAVLILATWLGWSMKHYGIHDTFLSNTTATGDAHNSAWTWLKIRAWNGFITIVPHPFRPAQYAYIVQTNRIGYVRDYWFNIYQTTLPGAFGFAGLILLARQTLCPLRSLQPGGERSFWIFFGTSTGTMGIMAASWADRWGVVHLCLVGLVIAGMSWLAARLDEFPGWLRTWWCLGLVVDLVLGIALQFYVQAGRHFLSPTSPAFLQEIVHELNLSAVMNLRLKIMTNSAFLERDGPAAALVIILLAALLAMALLQAKRRNSYPSP